MRCFATLFSLLLTSVACQADKEAKASHLIEAWEQGELSLVAALESLPAEDRWLSLRSLLNEHPQISESASAICAALRETEQANCEAYTARIQERPHLWNKAHQRFNTAQERPRVRGPARSLGSGPSTTRILPPADTDSNLLHLPAVDPACGSEDTQCRIASAQASLKTGAHKAAAQICLSLQSSWQNECFFRLGETQASGESPSPERDSFSWAVNYCLASQDYAVECLDQVLIAYWLSSPPSTRKQASAWSSLQGQSEAFLSFESLATASWRSELLGRLWSGLMHHSYQQSTTISDLHSPLSFPEKERHIRSAAAFRWVQQRQLQNPDWGSQLSHLRKWAQLLLRELEREPSEDFRVVSFTKIDFADHWQEDARGDSSYPAISYLGGSRRTWSDDPQIDTEIALLEAFARHRTALGLLLAAAEHPDDRVAWTARRLRDAAGLH